MKYFWITLFIVSGGSSLWFFGKSSLEFWQYIRLGETTPGVVFEWKIVEMTPSYYVPKGKFSFSVADKKYKAETLLYSLAQLNYFAAEGEIKRQKERDLIVWYDPKDPTFCSLERRFPYKTLCYAFISLAICGYFFRIRKISSIDILSEPGKEG